jgi:hypothetical protein
LTGYLFVKRIIITTITLATLVTLASCGRSKSSVLPDVSSEALEQEIARISPKLLWACGLPVEARRTDCSGDGISMAGWVGLVGDLWEWANPLVPFEAAVSADGRPWRASDRVDRQRGDSFSRDGLLGHVEAATATGVRAPLDRVWAYAKRTGALCPDATDNRCEVTAGVSILVRDALGLSVTGVERTADFTVMNAEAASAPAGYRASLVARKINLKVRQGRLTNEYAHASRVLLKRFPKNLWYRTVERMANKGTDGDFSAIGGELVTCMKRWEQPGTEWAWHTGTEACGPAQGHELVALARLLVRMKRDPSGLLLF